jgi:FKBP12-rapamycin complex-associated protein
MISKNIMLEILDKFLSVAVSDSDNEIRCTMLSSLHSSFDVYLNSSVYLKKLFICVNTKNHKIQELALEILFRLSRYNASYIIPFLKKKLYQCLSSLTIDE